MGWESHHSRSTHPRHLGQHSANLSPATPMCLLSSPDSDLFLSAQGAGFNRPYTLNNYAFFCGQDSSVGNVAREEFPQIRSGNLRHVTNKIVTRPLLSRKTVLIHHESKQIFYGFATGALLLDHCVQTKRCHHAAAVNCWTIQVFITPSSFQGGLLKWWRPHPIIV